MKNTKETLCDELIKLIYEFEGITGVEIHSIIFPNRISTTGVGDLCHKTCITTIKFDMK